jgi:hypothetical protein
MKRLLTSAQSLLALIFVLIPAPFAFAGLPGGDAQPIPEPSALSLFLVAGVAIYILKKRKK